jgi:UDP-N-acetylglucosamine 2-epimerase (non-hydrolysing)/GDP/UDP-N,N'-diacetylbacillosamine 2-epimerase (hydrolysing)
MNFPTAHIEGGDLTEGGALDDSVRHAMTKLAHLHFTTNEQSAQRVRNLGEEDWRVFNVGLPSLDLVALGRYATPEEVTDRLGIDPERPLVVFTQHSVTTEFEEAGAQVLPSLEALRAVAAEGYQVVITYPNNDAGGQRLIKAIQALEAEGLANIQVHRSLGRHLYHGLLNLCGKGKGACVGNSSSGIKETPVFHAPTVNIGSRQSGRLRSENLIDTGYDAGEITAAIRRCVESEAFIKVCQECSNPYGTGNAGARIAETLATVEINSALLQKKMTV